MSFKDFLAKEPILIVAGDGCDANSLSNILSQFQVPIQALSNTKDVLVSLRSQIPSVIVMAMTESGTDRIEFIKDLKKSNHLVQIVVINSNHSKELADKAIAAGVVEIIENVNDTEKIRSVVNKYLTQRVDFLKREQAELESLVDSFVEESLAMFKDIDQMILGLEEKPVSKSVVDGLFRKIHSVKGAAGTFPSGQVLAKLSHDFETALDLLRKGKLEPDAAMIDLFLTASDAMIQLLTHMKNKTTPEQELVAGVDALVVQMKGILADSKAPKKSAPVKQASITSTKVEAAIESKPAAESTTIAAIRKKSEGEGEDQGIVVSNEKLDSFLKLSGEMMMVKNYFQILVKDPEIRTNPEVLDKKFDEMFRGFNKITDALQKQIMELRQIDLDRIFSKLPRTVRTASQDLGKKVKITIAGGEIGVDKNIAKDLGVALNHMVRNSIDHGIEMPDMRAQNGKQSEGEIKIEASENGSIIQIVIEDDGAGLDPKKILAKALERGLVSEEKAKILSEAEIFDFIFMPGFSTAQQVTSISGRGVGMDVVKSMVLSYGGRTQISSKVGLGTRFVLLIPAPKSVLVESTVLVKDQTMILAAPLTEIAQITTVKDLKMSHVGNVRAFQFNNRTIPLMNYSELIFGKYQLTAEEMKNKTVLVLQHKDHFLGLLVDKIEGQLEAVVLPFDKMVKEMPGFKGTTLLGSDGVAYIMSSQQMIGLCDRSKTVGNSDEKKEIAA